ncbi:hypothetical protein KVT40_006006 [Elsinoe batatas]|uniref:Glyoxylate reductase n=1 Tax=Elsinoe batatas TaxID=2601811 RepID=A0A8K0PBC3_9PEZI|nr:hypothetical protein KVT40_006006 [Elsinoe batatas]
MSLPKVLLLGQIEHECQSGIHNGVIAILDRAPASITITGRYDKTLLSALPSSLRYICHMGAGYDNIDIAACTARGIHVSHAPGVVEDATADTALFLILAAMRGFNNGIMAIRNGQWEGKVPPGPLGREVGGKTSGILGMGGIGRKVKARAEACGMEVVYHNRTRLGEVEPAVAKYVEFEELLRRSDVLSLSLPLNAGTRNIISKREFDMMREGIVIVNTARGGVMDEEALVEALESGRVRSVGLDVYASEPGVHPGLLSNPHVCLLPHMGTSTIETKRKMEEWTIANVRAALETGLLKSIVPEQRNL